MKRLLGLALVSALLTVPAFAAKNTQSLRFPAPVSIGATQLPAGDYKVTWTTTGSNTEVTLEQRGKTPVTVAAKVVDEKHDHNGYTVNHLGGVDQLQAIQLDKVSLVLENPTASGQ